MLANAPSMMIPLRQDENGVIRVGQTRVLLELVIRAYYMGETPEGIVEMYTSLTLADVYAVLGYYLTNQAEVDAYMRAREQATERALYEMETARTPQTHALRARLRAYRDVQS